MEKKIDDINVALKSVQDSVEALDKDLTAVKDKQKSLDSYIVELNNSATFVGDQVGELNKAVSNETENRKILVMSGKSYCILRHIAEEKT